MAGANSTPSRAGRARVAKYWCASVAALAVALGALVIGHAPASVVPVAVLSQAGPTRAHVATFMAVPRSGPEELLIPALGIHIRVGRLGLQPDGAVEVPATTHTVGWFDRGVTPGQVGSAVILGHVDSYLGPGVFFDLKNLKANDRITVILSDGIVTRFRVTAVMQFAKTSFPDQLVFGSHGVRALQLVTCGGPFDSSTGHYLANVVVFSQLVSVARPTK
ncbi:MAG TPA: sortase [Acidimicrobiales bacterium]|nr:sortase [Acidimicrobiales bacterium]